MEGDWPCKVNQHLESETLSKLQEKLCIHGDGLHRSQILKDESLGYLSMPGVVKNDGRVGVVAKKDGHQGGDELMAQSVPGGGDLQQRQHQHVWAVLDGEAKELLHLLILAHL